MNTIRQKLLIILAIMLVVMPRSVNAMERNHMRVLGGAGLAAVVVAEAVLLLQVTRRTRALEVQVVDLAGRLATVERSNATVNGQLVDQMFKAIYGEEQKKGLLTRMEVLESTAARRREVEALAKNMVAQIDLQKAVKGLEERIEDDRVYADEKFVALEANLKPKKEGK